MLLVALPFFVEFGVRVRGRVAVLVSVVSVVWFWWWVVMVTAEEAGGWW